jgi:hypothetical protein
VSSPEPTTAAGWQDRLNTDFPHGAVVSWAGGDDVYTTPYFEVVGMDEGRPQVFWMVVTNADKGFGPLTISKYTPFQTTPHLLVRVTFTDAVTAMVWCAKLSPEMTRRMDAARQSILGGS